MEAFSSGRHRVAVNGPRADNAREDLDVLSSQKNHFLKEESEGSYAEGKTA